ncbi:ectopic P granules protein 5 homolog isoform X2 [Artemia franciscana]|uniref:Ectopic P granules protein 5 homolog n=1 Tax=Artemia franciscana TaxID=6661 RepID=A0AA88H6U1_ARTSF|nr:hypothetical protein QYM36_018343 [Artemia franciscana]KAK2703145.1 hypothetical protein QYM36_018343 [Artemia franciscana]
MEKVQKEKKTNKTKKVSSPEKHTIFIDDCIPDPPRFEDFQEPLEVSSGSKSLKTELDILQESISCCSSDINNDPGHVCDVHSKGEIMVASAPVLDEGFSEFSQSPRFSVPLQPCLEKSDLFQVLISEGITVLSEWNKRSQSLKEKHSPHLTLFQQVDDIVTQFVYSQSNIEIHELFKLIQKYRQSRTILTATLREYSIVQSNIENLRQSIWLVKKINVVEEGACLDGNIVRSTLEYPLAEYDLAKEKELKSMLIKAQEIVKEKISLQQNACELLRVKIEHYFNSVIGGIGEIPGAVEELKLCISVIFSFLRHLISDEHFFGTLRHWLSQLISILIEADGHRHYIFILNHLLRCPPGIAKWASNFLQIPKIQDDLSFEENILFLATLYSPIAHRDLFLDELRKTLEASKEDNWTFLDSEGEEEENDSKIVFTISANDLSLFTDQVDVHSMTYFLFCRKESQLGVDKVGEIFKRTGSLLKVFKSGLSMYCSERYRHFSKKVLRILKVVLQSLTDFWQEFLSTSQASSTLFSAQLQEEFDTLFLAFCSAMKESGCKGAWQIMATLSFCCLSYDCIWRLYADLHDICHIVRDESVFLGNPYFWSKFEDYLSSLNEAEIFSFLATLTGIAMSRSIRGDDFLKLVAWELCEVGFVCSSTRETASKGARDLLCTLTSRFPHILSFLLDRTHNVKSALGKLSLILWKSLPVHLWCPTYDDMGILNQWLGSHSLNSLESHLARVIIESLDFSNPHHLDRQKQTALGIIVIEACLKQSPEFITSSGVLGDSVRQMSSLASSVLQSQLSPVQVFQKWTWEFLGRLMLHLMDQSPENVSFTLANLSEALSVLPTYEQEASYDGIRRAVEANQPQAAYFVLISSSVGHNVPEFCTTGLGLLSRICSNGQPDQAVDLLHKILPMFFQCPDSLYSNLEYISLMSQILMEETGYIKFAKNMIVTQQLDLHIKRLGAAIEDHLINFKRYNLTTPLQIVSLWLETLFCLPKWNTNKNVLFIADVITRAAFFCETSRRYILNLFEDLIKNQKEQPEDRTLPRLLRIVGSMGSKTLAHPLIPLPTLPEFPWLSWFALKSYSNMEISTESDLWHSFLRNFSSGKFRTAELAFKLSMAEVGQVLLLFCDLTLFRWIEGYLQLEEGHQMETLYLQEFFQLYLERSPKSNVSDVTGSVGLKIFESAHEMDLIEKASARIKERVEKLKSIISEGSYPTYDEKRHVLYLLSIFEAYQNWITDKNLMNSTTYVPMLPISYSPTKLLDIFNGSKSPWIECISTYLVLEERQALLSFFSDSSSRVIKHKVLRPIVSQEEVPFEAKIKNRLALLSKPLPAPALVPLKVILPELQLELLTKPELLAKFLKPHLRALSDHAGLFCSKIRKLKDLNSEFLSLLPQEYKEERKKTVTVQACNGVIEETDKAKKEKSPCCGGAALVFEYVQYIEDQRIHMKIVQNREDYDITLAKLLETPSSAVIVAHLALEQCVGFLRHGRTKVSNSKVLMTALDEIGSHFFFIVLDYFHNADLRNCPPSSSLFSTCLENLGEDFISNRPHQCMEIITRLATAGREYLPFLAPHFTPLVTSPVSVKAYSFVEIYKLSFELLFDKPLILFSLITKFDFLTWLEKLLPDSGVQHEAIQVLFSYFQKLEYSPQDEHAIVFEVMRRHFRQLASYKLSRNLVPSLCHLVQASSTQSISNVIWFDFINVLSNGNISLKEGTNLPSVRSDVEKLVSQPNFIDLIEALEAIEILVRHFRNERQNHGLYGLYPRYRPYIQEISIVLYLIGRCVCVSTININRSTSPGIIVDKLWPLMCDLYAPWICTYSVNFDRQVYSSWIQQLSEDKLRLLPWISTDAGLAANLMTGLLDIITYLSDVLPNDQGIMSYLFLFYVENVCHPGVRSHISEVYHSGLLTLPWDKFYPTLDDLELMVSNVKIPETNSFFGTLLVLINWEQFLSDIFGSRNMELYSRCLGLLLKLIARLSNENALRQEWRNEFASLMNKVCTLPLHVIDLPTVEEISRLIDATIDPLVSILPKKCHDVDKALWRLFGLLSTMIKPPEHPPVESHIKRHLYIVSWVKLATTAAEKHPQLAIENEEGVSLQIKETLDTIESAVVNNVSNKDLYIIEMSSSLQEFYSVMKDVSNFSYLVSLICKRWLSSHSSGHFALVATLGSSASSSMQAVFLAEILETCLEAQFEISGESCLAYLTWDSVLPLVHLPDNFCINNFMGKCLEKNGFLCLYVYLSKKIDGAESVDLYFVIIDVYEKWLNESVIKEGAEPKFLLLLSLVLLILQRINISDLNEARNSMIERLVDISSHFISLCEIRSSWNLLNRFRSKMQTLSLRGMVLVTLVFYYITKIVRKLSQPSEMTATEIESLQTISHAWEERLNFVRNNKTFSDFASVIEDGIRLSERHSTFSQWKEFWFVVSKPFKSRYLTSV